MSRRRGRCYGGGHVGAPTPMEAYQTAWTADFSRLADLLDDPDRSPHVFWSTPEREDPETFWRESLSWS